MKKQSNDAISQLPVMSYRKIFLQGMVTNILNPKVAIFFLSFLPQFINPQTPWLKEQIALLGIWFAVQGTIILMVAAVLSGLFRDILATNKKFRNWQEKITGLILVGLGIRILFSKK
jgi:threonine/homoserine/homoserine lactone efflux protein